MTADDAALLPGPWFAAELLRLAGQRWRGNPNQCTRSALAHVIIAAAGAGLGLDVIEWAAGIDTTTVARVIRDGAT
jgi:hypothetical protein